MGYPQMSNVLDHVLVGDVPILHSKYSKCSSMVIVDWLYIYISIVFKYTILVEFSFFVEKGLSSYSPSPIRAWTSFGMLRILVVLLGRGKGVDPPEFGVDPPEFGVCYLYLSTFDNLICVWWVWAGVFQPWYVSLPTFCGHQILEICGHQNPTKNDPCNTPGWRGRPFECTQHKYKDTRRVVARSLRLFGPGICGCFQYSKWEHFKNFVWKKWDKMTCHLELFLP